LFQAQRCLAASRLSQKAQTPHYRIGDPEASFSIQPQASRSGASAPDRFPHRAAPGPC